MNNNYQSHTPKKKSLPSETSILVMSIIGIILSVEGISSTAGLIVCALALGKINELTSAGIVLSGQTKISNIIATIGMWYGAVVSCISLVSLNITVIVAAVNASLGILVSFVSTILSGLVSIFTDSGIADSFFNALFSNLFNS